MSSLFGFRGKKRKKDSEGEDPPPPPNNNNNINTTVVMNGGPLVSVARSNISTAGTLAAAPTAASSTTTTTTSWSASNNNTSSSNAESREHYSRTPLPTSSRRPAQNAATAQAVTAGTTTTSTALVVAGHQPSPSTLTPSGRRAFRSLVVHDNSLPRPRQYRPTSSLWQERNINNNTSSATRTVQRQQLQQHIEMGLLSTQRQRTPFVLSSTLARRTERWNSQGVIVSMHSRPVDPVFLQQGDANATLPTASTTGNNNAVGDGSNTDAPTIPDVPLVRPRVRRRRVLQEPSWSEAPLPRSTNLINRGVVVPMKKNTHVLGPDFHAAFSSDPIPEPVENKKVSKPEADPDPELQRDAKRAKSKHEENWSCTECSTVNSCNVAECSNSKCKARRKVGCWNGIFTAPKRKCPVCASEQRDDSATRCASCEATLAPVEGAAMENTGGGVSAAAAPMPQSSSSSFSFGVVGGVSAAAAPMPQSSSSSFSFGVVGASNTTPSSAVLSASGATNAPPVSSGGFQFSAAPVSQVAKPFSFGVTPPPPGGSSGTNGSTMTGGFQFGVNPPAPASANFNTSEKSGAAAVAPGFSFTAQNGSKDGEKPAKRGRRIAEDSTAPTFGNGGNDQANKTVSKPSLSAPFSFGASSSVDIGTSAPVPTQATGFSFGDSAPPASGVSATLSTENRKKRQGREEVEEDNKHDSRSSSSFAFSSNRQSNENDTTPETGPKPFVFGAPPSVPPAAPVVVDKGKATLPSAPFAFGSSVKTDISAEKAANVPFKFAAAPAGATEAGTSKASAPFSFPSSDTSAAPAQSSSSFAFGSSQGSSFSAQSTAPPAPGPSLTFGSTVPSDIHSAPPVPSVPPPAPFSFGSSASTSAADKPVTSAFAFGSTTAPSTNLPATSTADKPAASPFAFGSSVAPSSDLPTTLAPPFSFGSSAPTSLPGSSTSSPGGNESNLFSQAQGSVFGSTPAPAPTSLSFGSSSVPASTSAQPFQFGSTATASTPAPAAPFGTAQVAPAAPQFGVSSQSSTSQFGFGGQTQLQQQTSTSSSGTFQFGSSSTAAAPTPGGFGGPTSSFGATSAAPAAAPPSASAFVFGSQAASSAPAIGSFGQQQQTSFGQQQPALGGFGAAPAAGSTTAGFAIGTAPRGRRIVKAKRPGRR